tara:strand:- start:10 stop:552 length:543 start_codon:yes stop_codon:yes gene_type:complete
MKTIQIKGRKYTPVNERLKSFRASKKMIEINDQIISIEDRVITCNDKEIIMECTIKTPNGRVISRAHAHEYRDNSNINKTSFLENCSTSALGRALGYLGIGVDDSFASVDEMINALQNQDLIQEVKPDVETQNKKWLTEDQFNKTMICKDPGMIQNVMDKYKMKKDYRLKLELQLNTLNK